LDSIDNADQAASNQQVSKDCKRAVFQRQVIGVTVAKGRPSSSWQEKQCFQGCLDMQQLLLAY
jgi:hypothetical protein